MKVAVKIIILILAVTLAIGGVMIYAKTQVSPPVPTSSINQYAANLKDGFKSLEDAPSQAHADSVLLTSLCKIDIYVAESKLSEEEGEAMLGNFLEAYTPMFVSYANDAFSRSQWYDSDHQWMLARIQMLKGVRYYDNSQVLGSKALQELSGIQSVISDYRQAREVSRQTAYRGINAAQHTISQARRFAQHETLSNCTDLVRALNAVKPSIAESHYRYILGQVNSLLRYRDYTQAAYENELVPRVDAAVTAYDKKAVALYGSKYDVNPLWDKARGYYNEALEYYSK